MNTAAVCLVLALLAHGNCLLFSQQAPLLTPEQQHRLDSLKLTLGGVRVPSLSMDGTNTWAFSTSSRIWYAFKGSTKIGEPDFLRTVGLEKEARDSQFHQVLKSVLGIGGSAALLAGLALIVVPFVAPQTTTNQWGGTEVDPERDPGPQILLGAALGVGGAIAALVGVNMPENTLPYGRAEALAGTYNLELALKLAGDVTGTVSPADTGSL